MRLPALALNSGARSGGWGGAARRRCRLQLRVAQRPARQPLGAAPSCASAVAAASSS